MKSILLTIALSFATFFLVLDYLDKEEPINANQPLPAVEIKANNMETDTIQADLPEVTIRAKRSKFTSCAKAPKSPKTI
jgi:hypothetical protein